MSHMLERTLKRSIASLLRLLCRSTPPAKISGFVPRGILVIRQHNQLGDMLCVVPLLRALRARYPAARLDLMASPVNQDVMLNCTYLDRVVLFDKREFLRNGLIRALALFRFIQSVRGPYDMVLVPGTVSTSFTSDFLAFLTGAPVRIGVGSLDGRLNRTSFFFSIAEDLNWRADPHRHQTLRNLDIARSLALEKPDCSHEMTLTSEELHEGREIAAGIRGQHRLLVGLHPGAGKAPNRWPSEKFAALVQHLARRGDTAIFLTSGPMDEQVVETTRSQLRCPIQVLSNQRIRLIASIIKEADVYITNDTGVMHIAAAVGTPLVALFGPTDPLQWAPLGPNIRYIQGEGGRIETIHVQSVFDAVAELTGKPRA
jgi:ADP-heptose:LPS heptosyltransferase